MEVTKNETNVYWLHGTYRRLAGILAVKLDDSVGQIGGKSQTRKSREKYFGIFKIL